MPVVKTLVLTWLGITAIVVYVERDLMASNDRTHRSALLLGLVPSILPSGLVFLLALVGLLAALIGAGDVCLLLMPFLSLLLVGVWWWVDGLWW